MGNITFKIKDNFSGCVYIRTQVFVKEQGFEEKNEFDGFDKTSLHITAEDNGNAVGCARLYCENDKVYRIGRVAVLKEYRGKGIGGMLVRELEKTLKERGGGKIVIKAQVRVMPFYESLGYTGYGEEENEEGIMHIYMKKII